MGSSLPQVSMQLIFSITDVLCTVCLCGVKGNVLFPQNLQQGYSEQHSRDITKSHSTSLETVEPYISHIRSTVQLWGCRNRRV